MKFWTPAIFLSLAAALLSPAAQASIFIASGDFQDGSTLSGFVSIDTTTGLVNAADLLISGNGNAFTGLDGQEPWPPATPFLTVMHFDNGQTTDNFLTLLLPPVSLIGYGGGLLCGTSDDPSCFNGTSHFLSNFATRHSDNSVDTFVDLVSGSLTEAPEPSTIALCLAGLAVGVAMRNNRRGLAR